MKKERRRKNEEEKMKKRTHTNEEKHKNKEKETNKTMSAQSNHNTLPSTVRLSVISLQLTLTHLPPLGCYNTLYNTLLLHPPCGLSLQNM
jgi:hypothetical protein